MICIKCNEKLYVKDVRPDHDTGEIYRLYKCKQCGATMYTIEFETDKDNNMVKTWRKLNRSMLAKKGIML